MNFLVDAQLPPALARWIEGQGHQAVHVFDLGFHTADDPMIWQRAGADRATIITKDEDFVDRWLLSDKPVSLVWIRKGNCSNRALLAWLGPLWANTVKWSELGDQSGMKDLTPCGRNRNCRSQICVMREVDLGLGMVEQT